MPLLSNGGRIAIISFHSLEDRIVKLGFKELARDIPCKILTKKPLLPSKEEIKNNLRSRSAKLRVIEKSKASFYHGGEMAHISEPKKKGIAGRFFQVFFNPQVFPLCLFLMVIGVLLFCLG